MFDYKHSKFIECNKINTEESVLQINEESDLYKNKKLVHDLKYVKSVLELNKKNYWLAAGTLLGKILKLKKNFFLKFYF